jgi:nucleotide-binding universal stress UspA family protein
MADPAPGHILVLCENSRRGAAALQSAADEAARANARLTVIAVAVTEREHAGCCDRRSGYWNGVVRELAAEDLDRARSAIGAVTTAEFKVVTERSVLAGVALEARRSRADLIVVPPDRGIHRWFRTRRARRLQHRATGTVVVASPGYRRADRSAGG